MDTEELIRWARDNFNPATDEIKHHWSPIVIEECETMIAEQDNFDFENHHDSDLSGPAMQAMMDALINGADDIIRKELPDMVIKSNNAVHEIAELWIRCIELWKQQSDKTS